MRVNAIQFPQRLRGELTDGENSICFSSNKTEVLQHVKAIAKMITGRDSWAWYYAYDCCFLGLGYKSKLV